MTAYIGAYNLFCCRRYKKLVLFWRNRTRLANAPTAEQIISTYIRCHLPYQSACVNTWLPPLHSLDKPGPFRYNGAQCACVDHWGVGARYNDGTVYRSLYTVAKYMLAITYKTLK